MSARLPLLHKTPFVLDERPLYEATSPHAGLLSVSRVYRALGLPALVGANLALRKRQRGFGEAQFIESISLLQTVGGECPEDMHLLAGDDCLARGLGYAPPKATAVREFLERFHDQKLELLRPKREVQKSFIFPSSQPVSALQEVLSGQVRRIAKLYEKQGQPQRIATVDQDATIIESHKQAAYSHYEKEICGCLNGGDHVLDYVFRCRVSYLLHLALELRRARYQECDKAGEMHTLLDGDFPPPVQVSE